MNLIICLEKLCEARRLSCSFQQLHTHGELSSMVFCAAAVRQANKRKRPEDEEEDVDDDEDDDDDEEDDFDDEDE